MRMFYGNPDEATGIDGGYKDLDSGDAYYKVIFICRCSRGADETVTRSDQAAHSSAWAPVYYLLSHSISV
jgi:hypothetical protein